MDESKLHRGTDRLGTWVHMISGLMMGGVFALLLQTTWIPTVCAESRSVEGTYRNPALGYSIKIPHGMKGVTGDEDGPERSVRIPQASGSQIFVYGEPNSLEWKRPEEGVRDQLKSPTCNSGQEKISVGKLNGAKGSLICGDRILKVLLAFRPHGGPMYWIRLETPRVHESEDEATLETVAASFKLIPWK